MVGPNLHNKKKNVSEHYGVLAEMTAHIENSSELFRQRRKNLGLPTAYDHRI